MITVQQALQKVLSSTDNTAIIKINLLDSLGYTTSEAIYSPIEMPPFDQSSMDGYAISGVFASYDLVGEIQAGDTNSYSIKAGEAMRIFTGAMTPSGTTAIAKQEIVKRTDNTISLLEPVKEGTSIRRKGEEINKGALALAKGTLINAATIGLLSGLGFTTVSVYQKPTISLIVTGDELVSPGNTIKQGQIFESNSFTLKAALKAAGFDCTVSRVKDNYIATKNTLEKAINTSDVVLISGGISVGDYDFVKEALEELYVEEVFYKIKQKPGKPLYYGIKDKVKIFALPGNPASALTCLYVYVFTAIKQMMGYTKPTLKKREAIITHNHIKRGDRAHFLKAQLTDGKVTIHKGQSSAMLSSYAAANCLLYIPEDVFEVQKGDTLTVYLIP